MITFRSSLDVALMGHHGTDLDICRAAWVSSGNDDEDADEKRQNGLIRALLRNKHGTPFEAGYFNFRIEVPRAVRDEHVRHRIGSYSSSSLRYRIADKVVYIPPAHRPLEKAEGFKQIKPVYVPYGAEKYQRYRQHLERIYTAVAEGMDDMEADGFTETEAVRWVTQDGLYVAYNARFNPRMILSFLQLRTQDERATFPSYPMWEIDQVAKKIEQHFAHYLPLTYAAFNEFGRVAP